MDKEDPEKASPKSPIVINLCAAIFITCTILLTIVIIAIVIPTDSMNGTGKIRFWLNFAYLSFQFSLKLL